MNFDNLSFMALFPIFTRKTQLNVYGNGYVAFHARRDYGTKVILLLNYAIIKLTEKLGKL